MSLQTFVTTIPFDIQSLCSTMTPLASEVCSTDESDYTVADPSDGPRKRVKRDTSSGPNSVHCAAKTPEGANTEGAGRTKRETLHIKSDSEPIKKARRQQPWQYVHVPKGMMDTLWSMGETVPSIFPPESYLEEVKGAGDTRAQIKAAATKTTTQLQGPSEYLARIDTIKNTRIHIGTASRKFAQVLRLVANLGPPSCKPTTKYHGPVPSPPVWAEVSLRLEH